MVGAGAVVASGGTLAAAIAAAAIAGGGLIGGWAARFLGRDRAQALQHQLDHGGLLLWDYVRDQTRERRAIEILTNNGAEDVHVHDLPGTRDPADNPLTGVELDPVPARRADLAGRCPERVIPPLRKLSRSELDPSIQVLWGLRPSPRTRQRTEGRRRVPT